MIEGDIVELHEFVLEGIRVFDKWRPAVIIAVRPDKYCVKLLSGSFDDGHDRMWISSDGRGTQWR